MTRSNSFRDIHDISWKLHVFTNSRAITLGILYKSTTETPCAQLVHMLTNIHIKFHDSRSNIVWASPSCITSWKWQFFTKSRAITLTKQNQPISKTPGAQINMLSTFRLSFMTLGQILLNYAGNWKLPLFTKSMAITLTKQNKSTRETSHAQLHFPSNIPVKFHDPRSNTSWAMCQTSWK
jgi:hypothetical protein